MFFLRFWFFISASGIRRDILLSQYGLILIVNLGIVKVAYKLFFWQCNENLMFQFILAIFISCLSIVLRNLIFSRLYNSSMYPKN